MSNRTEERRPISAGVTALIGWGAYALAAYWVGTRWFRRAQTSANWSELLRTLGFAKTPRILQVLGVIPIWAPSFVGLVVLLWTLACTVVAIRHALDLDISSAVVTTLASWLVLFVVSWVLTVGLSAVV